MKTRLAILFILLAALIGLLLGIQVHRGSEAEAHVPGAPSTEITLVPCSPHLAELPQQSEYLNLVRTTLHIGTENDPARTAWQLLARAVATPGWADPEWVVSVYLSRDGEALVELVEADASIWAANSGGEGGRHLKRQPVAVNAHRFSGRISASFAQDIGTFWRTNLLQVKPVENKTLWVDAPTYTFLRNAVGDTGLCGEITGDATKLGLVRVAELLREYAKASEDDRLQIVDRIREEAI